MGGYLFFLEAVTGVKLLSSNKMLALMGLSGVIKSETKEKSLHEYQNIMKVHGLLQTVHKFLYSTKSIKVKKCTIWQLHCIPYRT